MTELLCKAGFRPFKLIAVDLLLDNRDSVSGMEQQKAEIQLDIIILRS
jgi:hypothetical protein